MTQPSSKNQENAHLGLLQKRRQNDKKKEFFDKKSGNYLLIKVKIRTFAPNVGGRRGREVPSSV